MCVAAVEVGNCPGHAKHLVVGAGERPISAIAPFNGSDTPRQAGRTDGLTVRHVGVVARWAAVEPGRLGRAGRGHLGAQLALPPPGVPPDRSRNATDGTSMWMSIRSTSGPDNLASCNARFAESATLFTHRRSRVRRCRDCSYSLALFIGNSKRQVVFG